MPALPRVLNNHIDIWKLCMLTDPENQEEQPYQYDEPIFAASPSEAERICYAISQRDGVTLVEIKQPRQIRKGTNQIYRCIFEANSIE